MAAGARVSVHVRMVLPSLQGEGQGWGLYLSVREPVIGAIFSAEKSYCLLPYPSPTREGSGCRTRWHVHELAKLELS